MSFPFFKSSESTPIEITDYFTVSSGGVVGGTASTGIQVRVGTARLFFANPSGSQVDYAFHANVPSDCTMDAAFYVNNYSENLKHAFKISGEAGYDDGLYMHQGTVTNFLNVNSPCTVTTLFKCITNSVTYLFQFNGNPARTTASCDTTSASDGALKFLNGATTYFIPFYTAGNTTGSW